MVPIFYITTFPRNVSDLLWNRWGRDCACAARRGSGIMASWTRHERRMRDLEMYILVLLVSRQLLLEYFGIPLCNMQPRGNLFL